MNIKLAILIVILLAFGCKKKDELSYKPLSFKSEKCADCPKVIVDIFEFNDGNELAKVVNSALKKEVINQLIYDDEIKVSSIEEAISSFKNGYLELKKMYPDETLGWEADIKGSVLYENVDVLSIKLETYIFTGGAHGYSVTRLLNFDKKKNIALENWELFNDPEGFKHFAELKFKIQEDIPQNGTINSTGLMFENDEFYLPNNIGFTKNGLQLIYNQYEVASYADGPMSITLPYAEIRNYLAVEIK
ncbi:DUF3298 and DUF4163 domain-containing protein [Cellulophaga tyrosinoxydans]|uniref:Deacetylase PdaC domain-containing protein n=1 Tax=Cellulophaga tyrosinoxydans TaxID=504486 RepID=A0A1W1Z393_9FLAO|nr:DUF3298 and DUF4163 domain-containing protein [Cellulophaga tyrosinoxydans]SMC42782.1 Protein of unknown function [Cellulophaga tyrosinoxydans]